MRRFVVAIGVALAMCPASGLACAQTAGGPRPGEREAIEAVKDKATVPRVQALAAYPGTAAQHALLDVIARSSSRSARSEAVGVLVTFFEDGSDEQGDAWRDVLGVALFGLSQDPSVERGVRERAMHALVGRIIDDPTFGRGVPILDLAETDDPKQDGVRRIASSAIASCVAQRPDDADRLAEHPHAAVRAAALTQIKQWRRLDERLAYRDVVMLLQWKDERLAAIRDEIGRTEAYVRKHPDQKDYTAWGLREAPSKKIDRLRRLERELRKAPILDFASYQITLYQDAMYAIAAGEDRAQRRVEGAYEPREPIEITFDEFEWQQVAGGSYDQVKVGESSFVIDFDEILGPRRPPTEAELAELQRPDSAHVRAIALAHRSIEKLYQLSPEAVELALDHFRAAHRLRADQAIRLPARR